MSAFLDGNVLLYALGDEEPSASVPATCSPRCPPPPRRWSTSDEPTDEIEVVPDFLPSPAELAFRKEGVKVTLALSRRSVEFFNSEASKHHTLYQRTTRRLLDAHVEAQQGAAEAGKTGRGRGARWSGGAAR